MGTYNFYIKERGVEQRSSPCSTRSIIRRVYRAQRSLRKRICEGQLSTHAYQAFINILDDGMWLPKNGKLKIVAYAKSSRCEEMHLLEHFAYSEKMPFTASEVLEGGWGILKKLRNTKCYK